MTKRLRKECPCPYHLMATLDRNWELISRRLQEVLGADIIKAILAEGRTPKAYWGVRADSSAGVSS